MADTKKTFDAVLAPAQYPAGKTGVDRLLALKAEFGPVLGCRLVHSRYAAGNKALITADPADHQCYGDGHPEAGQDRYDFLDRGDGVQYGLRKPDAAAAAPADEARAKADAMADRKATVLARRDALNAVPAKDRTPDQHAELAKLEKFIPVIFPDVPAPAPDAAKPADDPDPARALMSNPIEPKRPKV